ncbi:hypothetical protein ALP36_101570 [Pseudomonas syringae pv. coriandricola]|uniref:Uncharacterized protein n=1 Tax=Pseudomonas syringae pv. coriandricola TaxID=264453 RepID=A0A3M5R7L7_9PSED|nr:hypothetical protein ALP36_101570 [Pseudomonas syringae pv. coriandricola]
MGEHARESVTADDLLGSFVVQRGVEIGALLQIFRGVGLAGVSFFISDVDTGAGRKHDACRNSRCSDDGENIEVHVGHPSLSVCTFA